MNINLAKSIDEYESLSSSDFYDENYLDILMDNVIIAEEGF